MLPSQEQILKRNTGFKELVLSSFTKAGEEELARVKSLIANAGESYVMPDHEDRLYLWLTNQLKNNIIINPSAPLEAKSQYVHAVLALFNELDDDDIEYTAIPEGEKVDLNNYVDWDLSKQIIKAKIIDSEYLYGLAL